MGKGRPRASQIAIGSLGTVVWGLAGAGPLALAETSRLSRRQHARAGETWSMTRAAPSFPGRLGELCAVPARTLRAASQAELPVHRPSACPGP